jgi:hypothetical protein
MTSRAISLLDFPHEAALHFHWPVWRLIPKDGRLSWWNGHFVFIQPEPPIRPPKRACAHARRSNTLATKQQQEGAREDVERHQGIALRMI